MPHVALSDCLGKDSDNKTGNGGTRKIWTDNKESIGWASEPGRNWGQNKHATTDHGKFKEETMA